MTQAFPSCRSCDNLTLKSILSLGHTPLANALLKKEELNRPEPIYPLDLAFCSHCTLVQITETVPPEQLFSRYFYFSSFSNTMLQHAKTLVERLIALRRLDEHSLVIEIASNDGYLLQYYHQRSIPVLGIEPAANVAQIAQKEKGIQTLCEFFGADIAQYLKQEGQQADIIHAHNVMAHVADLTGFVQGIQLLLKEDGLAVIEVPYVKDLIDHCEFDTIYHEHLCYFSLMALNDLFQRFGLQIINVERIPIHGGSLRIFVAKEQHQSKQDAAVADLLAEEVAWGVADLNFYQGFAQRVKNLKGTLRNLLLELKQEGKQLAAYGAAAKGSTLLNYFGIGSELLDFVVDRSDYKQGYYMPGVHLSIHSPAELMRRMPDYVLLLTWNFADEILEQQAEYRQRGGRFIIPIPEVKIV